MAKDRNSGRWVCLPDKLIRVLTLGLFTCAALSIFGCIKSQTHLGSQSVLITKPTGKHPRTVTDPYALLTNKGEPPSPALHPGNAVIPPIDFSKKKIESSNAENLEDQFPEIAQSLSDVKLDPENPQKHLRLGKLYHSVRVYDRALEEYEAAAVLDPDNPVYYESIGRLLRDAGDYQRGIESTQKALQLDPNSPEVWNTLGTIYDRMGERESAQQAYSHALSIRPDLDFVQNNLCSSFLQEGKYSKALTHCEQAVKLNPMMTAAHNNLGIVQGMLGDRLGAYESFRRVGDEASAHNNLGWVLLQKGDLDIARDQFKLAARLRPNYRMAGQNYQLTQDMIFIRSRQARRQGTGDSNGSLDGVSPGPLNNILATSPLPNTAMSLSQLWTVLDYAIAVAELGGSQDGLKTKEISSDMNGSIVGKDDILKRQSILRPN